MSDNSNYMLIQIELGYECSIVLQHEEGSKLISYLKNAKAYNKPYNEESTIRDLKKGDVKTDIIGAQEYGEAILRSTILAKKDC